MAALSLLPLAFSIALWPSAAFANDHTTTSSSSATGVAPAFPTMSGQDGVGVPVGGVGSQASGNVGGNSGSDQGAFNISTGAIIGISVAVGVAVISIGESAVLRRMACNMGLTILHSHYLVIVVPHQASQLEHPRIDTARFQKTYRTSRYGSCEPVFQSEQEGNRDAQISSSEWSTCTAPREQRCRS